MVPDKFIHLTEYGVWADFLYAFQFTKPGSYKSLRPDCEELTVRRYNEILEDLKKQRKPSEYKYPQVVLEKINPAWLKSYHLVGKGEGLLDRILEGSADRAEGAADTARQWGGWKREGVFCYDGGQVHFIHRPGDHQL